MSAGYGADNTNGGINGNMSKGSSKRVAEQTSLTGGTVNIDVAEKTTLRGAVIASDTGDLTLATGSLEYSHIKDRNSSTNFGGGISGSTGNKNVDAEKGVSSASYGFSDSRQTNFATIGEGEITIRDGSSIGSPDDYNGLKRDVSKAQYGSVSLGVQLSADKSTIDLLTNPADTFNDTMKGIDQIADRGKKIEEQTHVVEKTGNLVEHNHFTTDDKVQYCLNMDDYEALKEAGGEITSLDTLVYVKSKSAAGYELDRSDISDLSLASGFVIDDATNGIRENLEANIRVNSREEVLVSLSVLDRFDSEDAALARGYLLRVRTEGYYSQQLETNSSLRGAELGQVCTDSGDI